MGIDECEHLSCALLQLIDNLLAIEPVKQVQRAVLSHQPVYGHLGTGRSAGLILRYCITSGEPATEQCNAVAARDMGEGRSYPPPVNEERHGQPTDVDIHALALELEDGELAGLRIFAGHLDGDVFAISHLRFCFKVVGHNTCFRIDADKRRGLRVVLIEPRQFGPKGLDVWCNHMAGIPLGVGEGLQLLGVNPDTEVPRILVGIVLLPALGQQCGVVVVAVCLMATPVDAAAGYGKLKRDTPRLVSLLDPTQQLEGLGSATAITEWLLLCGPQGQMGHYLRCGVVVELADGSGELSGGQGLVITQVVHGGGASFKCKQPLGVRGCMSCGVQLCGGDCL